MASTSVDNSQEEPRAEGWPVARWLRGYQRGWLLPDAIAGVTVAAFAIPVSMAYATLAGLPTYCGIYCYLFGGLAYALFGSCRQLAIGPTAAMAVVVGASVAELGGDDPDRRIAIAGLTALAIGWLCGMAWLLRLSSLISFIGDTILIGFKAGAALSIALTQLPKMFGVPGGGDNFFDRLWMLIGQLPHFSPIVLTFGLAALILLLLGEKLLPGRPVALAVVVLSIIVVSVGSLDKRGIDVVGTLPSGLPSISFPSLRYSDVDGILPLACACFLLSYIESVSAARTLANKNGYEIDPRQELLAIGVSNFAVAFGQGFPVAGGLSQSSVNDKAGAKTPLSLVFVSLTLTFCLLFLTETLRNLPSVVLAAVVLVAVRGLIDIAALKRLYQLSRTEFTISMLSLAGVLVLGILKGVLLAAIASLAMLISSVARPNVAFLGRIPGTRRFSDVLRHPDNVLISGVLIFRVEASLLYFNVDHVRQVIWNKVHSIPALRYVVYDLSSSAQVDVAGARMLSRLQHDLAARGIQLKLVDALSHNRDLLRAEGIEEGTTLMGRQYSLNDVITEIEQSVHTVGHS